MVRTLFVCSFLGLLPAGLAADEGRAEEVAIAPAHHPWGGFQSGAWKSVRVVAETLDETGLVISTSSTETKTILAQIDKDGLTLESDVVVEVAGKRFAGEPQIIRQGFHGETLTPEAKIKPATAGEVTIEDRRIPCHVIQLENNGTASQTITTLYFSDTVAPYVLKRESTTSDLTSKMTLSENTEEVVALDLPWKVHGEIVNASILRTIQRHPKGTVTSWAINSTKVPGGVIYQTSKETDKSGRLVRRSTLELVDYAPQCEEEEKGTILRGKRRGRYREAAPHATRSSK